MSSSFGALGVPADLVDALNASGISEPFPVQAACLPDALAGRDLCGRAPTGSGKTLAFGIPMMARISRAEAHHPTGIILVPTRELAKQVRTELVELGKASRRYILAVYGGVPYASQLASLRRGAALLVACPGRLLDLVERGAVSLDSVEVAVIDEADRMSDLGFLPEVVKLLDMMPKQRQTMLFSATLDGDVDELVRRHQNNPVRHDLVGDVEQPDIEYRWERVKSIERLGRAAGLIRQHGQTMVFAATRLGAERLVEQLGGAGIRATAIHGGLSQGQRERSLEAFRKGRYEALVGTDVAARGIHVDNVSMVLQWDLPSDPKDFLHRSGRTARAGAAGLVVVLVPPQHDRTAMRLMHLVDPTGEMIGDAPSARQRPANAGTRRPMPSNRPGWNGGGQRDRRYRASAR
ncbi:MAG: DEAD/DEAH box helicase [Acidimicrobiia bacterium]